MIVFNIDLEIRKKEEAILKYDKELQKYQEDYQNKWLDYNLLSKKEGDHFMELRQIEQDIQEIDDKCNRIIYNKQNLIREIMNLKCN